MCFGAHFAYVHVLVPALKHDQISNKIRALFNKEPFETQNVFGAHFTFAYQDSNTMEFQIKL